MSDLIEAIMKAKVIAFNEAIEANTVLINKEFGKVLPFSFEGQKTPPMICGLKAYISKDVPEKLGFLMLKSKANEKALVEVVRCKDCHFCDPENHHCDHPMGTTIPVPRKPTDFCSYGEPRGERKE